jgi:hypothetical protein
MKHARNSLSQFSMGLALAGLLFLGTGCTTVQKYSLTHRLWDNGDLRKWSEPATNPDLILFRAANGADVLVQYDALSEKRSAVKRRAYYLQENSARVAGGKKPHFVNPSQAAGLTPIPVLKWDSVNTNAPPDFAEYAVTAEDGWRFDLYPSTGRRETHDLPVYPESSGTAARIALTPFAVAGDTVMVAGVVALVVIIAFAESYAYCYGH